MMNKKQFYPLVKELLESKGFVYYPEEAIKGIGRGSRKPDFVAIKGNMFLVGEIKSPAETPLSSSWRSEQPYDSENMRTVRRMVRSMEKEGRVPPEVGGHAIIMLGQIPEYIMLLGKRWLPPEPIEGKKIVGAYAFPVQWRDQVEKALLSFGIESVLRIDDYRVQVVIF